MLSENKDFKVMVGIGVFLIVCGILFYFAMEHKYGDRKTDEELVIQYVEDTYGYNYDNILVYGSDCDDTIEYFIFKDGVRVKYGVVNRKGLIRKYERL